MKIQCRSHVEGVTRLFEANFSRNPFSQFISSSKEDNFHLMTLIVDLIRWSSSCLKLVLEIFGANEGV